MASRTPNLQLRGNVYKLRVRVPDALRPIVGKNEVVRSLGTGDYKTACQRARWERNKLDVEWDELRRRHSPEKTVPLSENDVLHLVSKWLIASDRADAPRSSESNDSEPPSYEDAVRELGYTMDWDMAAPAVFQLSKRLLTENHRVGDENAGEFLLMQKTLHRAMMEAERRRIIQQFPDARIPLDPLFREATKEAEVKPVAKSLSALIQEMQDDPLRPRLHGKTLAKRQAQWRMLESYFGPDKPVACITREEVKAFARFLMQFPSNASKHFPNAHPRDIPALARAKKLEPMTTATANDYLRQLGSLTRFALNEGIITTDPAKGSLIKSTKVVAAKDRRLPFSTNDLRRIFGAPLFRGCVDDERGYSTPGPHVLRRGRFWVPLISLFTGMRLNEICQLTLDDFTVVDETDIILIRGSDDDTKRVKTEAGHRFIPVHPELRAIGLLDDIQKKRRLRRMDAPLFEELPLGSTGYRSDPFSKFFAKFLHHVGVTDRKKVFHSFRHTYRDALREADISAERVRALGGWTSGRTEEIYGSGLRPKTLAIEVEKIRYPDLDLSGLHISQPDGAD